MKMEYIMVIDPAGAGVEGAPPLDTFDGAMVRRLQDRGFFAVGHAHGLSWCRSWFSESHDVCIQVERPQQTRPVGSTGSIWVMTILVSLAGSDFRVLTCLDDLQAGEQAAVEYLRFLNSPPSTKTLSHRIARAAQEHGLRIPIVDHELEEHLIATHQQPHPDLKTLGWDGPHHDLDTLRRAAEAQSAQRLVFEIEGYERRIPDIHH